MLMVMFIKDNELTKVVAYVQKTDFMLRSGKV